MDEQFILRVPPSVAEKIEQLLNESCTDDTALDLAFNEDGRTGSFVIGEDRFSASLLDLPTVVESYKTYDDTHLIKTADIGQIIMVREESESVPETLEYRHGITPPMRDARRRRFRRDPELNPKVVRKVEEDLHKIMTGGTAENSGRKVIAATATAKHSDVPEAGTGTGEPEGSDSDESDDSMSNDPMT